MPVSALLFDKDGTLFDFNATWNGWAHDVIREFSAGDAALARALAQSVRFDLDAVAFHADSPVIAGTNREAAECMAAVLPHMGLAQIERHLELRAATASVAPAVPLDPFLDGLAARGLKLGVMTNDSEYSALGQLGEAGVAEKFDFIAGFDSGYGAKPSPDPLLAFCDAVGVAPELTAMVGDSTHDLIAGRAAGMRTIGVLTGPAEAAELAPFADHVFPNIGHIPDWLAR